MEVFYDYTTRNKSFIDIYLILKDKGIKNNNFHLLLFDKSLVGVDPRDPGLSNEVKHKIIEECSMNIWYFLREVARVPAQGSSTGAPVNLNLTNLAQVYLYINKIHSWAEGNRQCFKIGICELIGVYNELFGNKFEIKAHKKDLEKYNMYKFSEMKKLIPEYLRQTVLKNNGNNSDKIILYPDAEFNKNLLSYDNIMCPKDGTVNMFTSTINDNADSIGIAQFIETNGVMWDESFYNHIPELKNCNFVFIKYSYKELGFSEEWFYMMSSCLCNDKDTIRREILLERKK